MKNSQEVEKVLFHHLSDEDGKAVLLSGAWGCGKTYLWKERLAPQFQAERPITLSLFGMESVASLKSALVSASLLRRATLAGEGDLAAASKNIKKLLSAGLRKGVDLLLGADFLSTHIDPLQLIEEGLIICLDDLERAASSLSLKEILGVATLLAESKKARVLLISNEEALASGSHEENAAVAREYKERVVTTEMRLDAELESAFSLFSKKWEQDPRISGKLLELRPQILNTFYQASLNFHGRQLT